MRDNHDISEYTNRERELFGALARESTLDPALENRVVAALAVDGYFRRPSRTRGGGLAIAAGVLLFVSGGAIGSVAGARYASRNTLEAQIARTDLTAPERVLLLQRAGSAYVRAANGYAAATARADSTAAEVASQVLVGAAQAVARSRLESRVATGLTAVLQRTAEPVAPKSKPSILWF